MKLTPNAIRAAEARLKTLGYDPGAVDGKIDAQTTTAIAAFRHDDRMEPSTRLTLVTRRALIADVKGLQHAPQHARVRPSKTHERLDALTKDAVSQTFDGQLGLGEGVKGRSVVNVQARLKAAGFDPSRQDGTFDARTKGAVMAFQRRSGMEPTGRVDSGTWKKLAQANLYAKTSTSPAQALGEKSGAVRGSEKLLRRLGFEGVKADGLFTDATRKAVMRFERKAHRKVDGKIGTGDLKAMRKLEAANSTKTVAGCAKLLLASKNVSFWTALSTGSDRKALVALANGHKIKVPVTGRMVTPKLKMMQALVDMAKHGRIQINALTGGVHSSLSSNHYKGTAVDLEIRVGDPAEIARIARKYGGFRNNESDHIHIDF